MTSSPLQDALQRGLADDGNLVDELKALREYQVESEDDARAIVDALGHFPRVETGDYFFNSPLQSLVNLFQKIESKDAPAVKVLLTEGTMELVRIVDDLKNNSPKDGDLMFLLKILAMFGTRIGSEALVEAARAGVQADSFVWQTLLKIYNERHPHQTYVFESLSNPIPPGFIAVALLDAANALAIDGKLEQHPFDSDQGIARLETWLKSRATKEFSYAHSSVAALPFINGPKRDELLGFALEHADGGVCVEAAWAAAKLEKEIGYQRLADFSCDVNRSKMAIRYLEELERGDLVPAEATEPGFAATAEFSSWIAHPNELGRAADELKIVDQRVMHWPPAGEERPLWLIQYWVRDEHGLEADNTNIGFVGGTTWCFFSDQMPLRPPEDCYALHCCWEMQLAGYPAHEPEQYESLVEQWPLGEIADMHVTNVMEIPPEVNYGSEAVGMVQTTMGDEPGWAVFDGPRSAFYADAEMPDDPYGEHLLQIHVGRQLLGFGEQPDRKKYLTNVQPGPKPEQVVAAYEKLLEEIKNGDVDFKKNMVADRKSPVKYFDNYLDACESTGQKEKSAALMDAYQILFDAVQVLPAESLGQTFGHGRPLTMHFDAYVEAMVAAGRNEEITQAVAFLEPHWDHNMGYGDLGTASYKAGDMATAERFFLKLRELFPNHRRSEEMSLLATHWFNQGKTDEARDLLIDCLKGVAAEAAEASESDREHNFERWYQNHYPTFLKLFPDQTDLLAKEGLRDTIL